jgi:hypothetical protein
MRPATSRPSARSRPIPTFRARPASRHIGAINAFSVGRVVIIVLLRQTPTPPELYHSWESPNTARKPSHQRKAKRRSTSVKSTSSGRTTTKTSRFARTNPSTTSSTNLRKKRTRSRKKMTRNGRLANEMRTDQCPTRKSRRLPVK